MARDTVFSVRACHFAPRQLRQQGNERPYYIKEVQAVKEEGWAERLTNNCTTVCEWNKGISAYIRRYTYAAIRIRGNFANILTIGDLQTEAKGCPRPRDLRSGRIRRRIPSGSAGRKPGLQRGQ